MAPASDRYSRVELTDGLPEDVGEFVGEGDFAGIGDADGGGYSLPALLRIMQGRCFCSD